MYLFATRHICVHVHVSVERVQRYDLANELCEILTWVQRKTVCQKIILATNVPVQSMNRLRNDLYCVEWGVKLYSSQQICRCLWLQELNNCCNCWHSRHSVWSRVHETAACQSVCPIRLRRGLLLWARCAQDVDRLLHGRRSAAAAM